MVIALLLSSQFTADVDCGGAVVVAVVLGVMTHVAVVCSALSGVQLFIDGVACSLCNINNTINTNSSQNIGGAVSSSGVVLSSSRAHGVVLGAQLTAQRAHSTGAAVPTNVFSGVLCELRLWNTVRSVAELQHYSNRRLAGNEP